MKDSGVETAWKIHAILADWTGKVDTKATFALTIEAAALSAVVLLTRPDQPFSQLDAPVSVGSLWFGCLLLGAAALSAIDAVVPRTRTAAIDAEWPRNYVYFGHLRHWQPEELAERLANKPDDLLPVLCRQLVNMSKIAWLKHRRVQLSLTLAAVGVTSIALAAIVG